MKRFRSSLAGWYLLFVILMLQPMAIAQDPLFPVPTPVAPTATTTTLNTLIDEAVDKLPPVRKRALKRLLSNPKWRAEVVDHVAERLVDQPCCKSFGATLNSETFDGNTPLAASAIDPDLKKKILDLIMQILPIILSIFFKI